MPGKAQAPRLLERIRERPKLQAKEDGDTPRNGLNGSGEASGTVKVTRNSAGRDTVKVSQGRTLRNAGWDFSIGESTGIGTVQSAVRPPQEEMSMSGTGTVVVRSPRGVSSSSLFGDQSSLSSSTFTSLEAESTSGTIVYHGEHDESDSPRAPKPGLGIQERTSSTSLEDSAMNLAKAKAAIQAELKGGNVRERSSLGKVNRNEQKGRRTEQSTTSSDSSRDSREFYDAQKVFPISRQTSDEEVVAKSSAVFTSAPLSILLIPSLKEAIACDWQRSIVQTLVNSFIDVERIKPGSCDLIVTTLLQRLASSKDSSLKDLQELADRLFNKNKTEKEAESTNAEVDGKKTQQNKELHSNANLNPLARFLLSRWQGHAYRDFSN